MVWPTVVSAVRLFRRALLTGEAGLRQSFLRAMSTAHRVDNIDFEVVDPDCDWALVLEKLKAAQADLAQTAAAAAAEWDEHRRIQGGSSERRRRTAGCPSCGAGQWKR